jgi:hypothetical protein
MEPSGGQPDDAQAAYRHRVCPLQKAHRQPAGDQKEERVIMATVTKGDFSLNLGFVKLGAELSDQDRQCAWELYAEIATRVAVVGKRSDKAAKDFDGELYADSLDSLYAFFRECRAIMRRFPVGRIKDCRQDHLGIFINRILASVLRPFLEKWNCRFRTWWAQTQKDNASAFEVQQTFPDCAEFLTDWTALRLIMRRAERKLAQQYKLVQLD